MQIYNSCQSCGIMSLVQMWILSIFQNFVCQSLEIVSAYCCSSIGFALIQCQTCLSTLPRSCGHKVRNGSEFMYCKLYSQALPYLLRLGTVRQWKMASILNSHWQMTLSGKTGPTKLAELPV